MVSLKTWRPSSRNSWSRSPSANSLQPTRTLPLLPPELVCYIFEYAVASDSNEQGDPIMLASIARVSRSWHPWATPRLYNRPAFSQDEAGFESFLEVVKGDGKLATRIKSVTLSNFHHGAPALDGEGASTAPRRLLAAMRGLEVLQCSFGRRIRIQDLSLGTNLRSLRLHDVTLFDKPKRSLFDKPKRPLFSSAPHFRLPALRHLYLTSSTINSTFLSPSSLPSLTAVYLDNVDINGHSVFQLELVDLYPQLTTVSCGTSDEYGFGDEVVDPRRCPRLRNLNVGLWDDTDSLLLGPPSPTLDMLKSVAPLRKLRIDIRAGGAGFLQSVADGLTDALSKQWRGMSGLEELVVCWRGSLGAAREATEGLRTACERSGVRLSMERGDMACSDLLEWSSARRASFWGIDEVV